MNTPNSAVLQQQSHGAQLEIAEHRNVDSFPNESTSESSTTVYSVTGERRDLDSPPDTGASAQVREKFPLPPLREICACSIDLTPGYWLTVARVCETYGIGRATLYRWIKAGLVKSVCCRVSCERHRSRRIYQPSLNRVLLALAARDVWNGKWSTLAKNITALREVRAQRLYEAKCREASEALSRFTPEEFTKLALAHLPHD